jgi:hypothetical protein
MSQDVAPASFPIRELGERLWASLKDLVNCDYWQIHGMSKGRRQVMMADPPLVPWKPAEDGVHVVRRFGDKKIGIIKVACATAGAKRPRISLRPSGEGHGCIQEDAEKLKKSKKPGHGTMGTGRKNVRPARFATRGWRATPSEDDDSPPISASSAGRSRLLRMRRLLRGGPKDPIASIPT